MSLRFAAFVIALACIGCGHPKEAESPPSAPAAGEAPDDYVQLVVGGVLTNGEGHAVILLDEARQTAVPVFVGETEALTIALRHERQRYARPLTHDLLDALLARLGGELVRIQIDDIEDDVFVGAIYVKHAGEIFSLDARPSDAIALALGHRVPIWVHERVVSRAGIQRPEGPEGLPPSKTI